MKFEDMLRLAVMAERVLIYGRFVLVLTLYLPNKNFFLPIEGLPFPGPWDRRGLPPHTDFPLPA
jgi:hypothetical protein